MSYLHLHPITYKNALQSLTSSKKIHKKSAFFIISCNIMNKVFIPLSTQCTKQWEKKNHFFLETSLWLYLKNRKKEKNSWDLTYIQYYFFLFICFLFMHTFSHMDTTKHSSHDEMMRETGRTRGEKKIFYRSATSMNSELKKKSLIIKFF